jgi:hypothetical protein
MQFRNLRDRIVAFEHYRGADGVKCACCGEDEFSFLTLDHVDGGGNTERAKLFGDRFQCGHHMYRKLRLTGYPPGYQLLCMNCQVGRRDNGGVCPHQANHLSGTELLAEFDRLRVGWGNVGMTETEEYKAAYANIMRKGKATRSVGVTVAVEQERQRRLDRVSFQNERQIRSSAN